MAASVWIVAVCILSLFHTSSAINAYIAEKGPVVLAGTNLTLHCILDLTAETTRNASDVKWVKNFSDELDNIHLQSTLNESVATLSFINSTFVDSGSYFCKFDGDNYFQYQVAGTTVHVGYPPDPVRNLRCYSTNVIDFTCEWDDGRDTNLRTYDTLYFQGHYPDRTWTACEPEGENNYCIVRGHSRSKVYVTSDNALGSVNASLGREFNADLEVRPHAPDEVESIATERRMIHVSWRPPSDWSTHYSIDYFLQYRIADSDWNNVTHESITSESYLLQSLEPYTEYHIQVAAAYGAISNSQDRFGTWSDEITQRTLPEEPTANIQNFTVLQENDNTQDPDYARDITLKWTAVPVKEHRGLGFGYNITVRDDNNNVVRYKTTTNTLAIIQRLNKFQEFTIRITPYNNVGLGTNHASRPLHDQTRNPQEPRIVNSVPRTPTSIEVTWTDPLDIDGYVEEYILQWSDTQRTWNDVSLTNGEHSYVVRDLEPYQTYHFRVQIRNKLGRSGWTYSQAMTRQTAPSGPPTSIKVEAIAPNRLQVSWKPPLPDQQNGEITKYTISYCVDDSTFAPDTGSDNHTAPENSLCQNGTLDSLITNGLEETIEPLTAFTTYIVWVAAFTSAGRGPFSLPFWQRTQQGTPSAPTDLRQTFMNSSVIQVKWDAPEILNGELRHYKVQYNGETQTEITEMADLYVEGGKSYDISVRACTNATNEDVACGDGSNSIRVMTDIGAPQMVQAVSVTPETPDKVVVSWKAPEITNGPIERYEVRHRPAGGKHEWDTHITNTTSDTVKVDCSLVKNSTMYVFQVLAVNKRNGVWLRSPASAPKQYEMCGFAKAPTLIIVLSVMIPGILLLAGACFVIWIRQSDFFKPAPDPYFIGPVLDPHDDKFQMKGRLLIMRSEKENFNTLRQADSTTNLLLPPYDRLSSKESTSTSSSTDQGIHDMDGFTDDLRYVSEKTNSRGNSESDEEKMPAKHLMRIMSDDYEEEDAVFKCPGDKHDGCDGSVTYSRIAEADGVDSSTPMLGKEQVQYQGDGSESYAQLSQVAPPSTTTPPASPTALQDQRSEASFGSQSTVSYHRLGVSGLTPITSVETIPSEEPLAYSRLSQGSEPDIEYSQLASASSNPTLSDPATAKVPAATDGKQDAAPTTEDSKGVAMSLPTIPATSRIQPQQEFIVATALAPGSHPQPVTSPGTAGYVTGPQITKPVESKPEKPPPVKAPPVEDTNYVQKHLADTKAHSASDSSLTDGEGYSTLGLAESPTSSPPHQQPQMDPYLPKPPVAKPEANAPLSNGYVPNSTIPHTPQKTPADIKPATNGYVTETELKAIPSPPQNTNRHVGNHEPTPTPESRPPPVQTGQTNGLPKAGVNGYVANTDLPSVAPVKAVEQKRKEPNAANPYITHDQAAQMPVRTPTPPGSPATPPRTPPTPPGTPPDTPTTPLNNNNNPLPCGKKPGIHDPYVSLGQDRNISAVPPLMTNGGYSVC